ncbi:sirohydrochlorin cobaltochelatase [Clostridium sp.]|jgi:sirohydrochlorin cobaltochelatase|uniref:sirohydrochlorin cobaltochelatase n=1 Tax=Clostridium sp. TaxID=1506 RepID=UPI002FDE8BAB
MKKAILVISFGTTYENTRRLTIDVIENKIRKEFKDYEIRRAFTAYKIISTLKSRDKIMIDTPEDALEKLKNDGFEQVIVQPLHIIPGGEYDFILRVVERYNRSFKEIKVGRPVLFYKGIDGEIPDDYDIMAEAIKDIIPKDNLSILMGHGSTHWANACYSCFQLVLREKGFNNCFIANVEGYPDFGTIVSNINRSCTFSRRERKKIKLIPLMLVAGNHARIDMAGEEEDSWKNILVRQGFDVEAYIHGLGEIGKFQNIYISHIQDVIDSKYDYILQGKKEYECQKL